MKRLKQRSDRPIVSALPFFGGAALALYLVASLITGMQACRLEQLPQCPAEWRGAPAVDLGVRADGN